MKLVTPYTGVVIEVPDTTKDIYLHRGYKELKEAKPKKAEKKAEVEETEKPKKK